MGVSKGRNCYERIVPVAHLLSGVQGTQFCCIRGPRESQGSRLSTACVHMQVSFKLLIKLK
jgi:hypothetical protein